MPTRPLSVTAAEAPPRGKRSNYHLVKRTSADVVLLEIGDRTPGDTATYPDDDLQAELGADGTWRYRHKDGTPY